jgi:hypothetical protein
LIFIDKERRTLDFHFLLWKYDMSKADTKSLQKIDARQGGEPTVMDNESDEDLTASQQVAAGVKRVEQVHGSSCCIIF